jgi:hypothetical protein
MSFALFLLCLYVQVWEGAYEYIKPSATYIVFVHI